jgi:hypothetical protein
VGYQGGFLQLAHNCCSQGSGGVEKASTVLDEHVHALRSRERGCFLVVQATLWAEKIQSTTDAGLLNTFGRNEIEVAPISSALLRIACLVILYKTCRVPDQELAADGVSGPV